MTEDFRGPSARGFDWEHILGGHSRNGRIAQQSGIKTIFGGLTEDQVKACVRAAWRKRRHIRSQFNVLGVERIFYRGEDPKSGEVVEFWYNVKTRIVETAYPVRMNQ